MLARALLAAAILLLSPAALAQANQTPKFDIEGFRVEGNTVLPAAEVNETLKPFIGKQRDFADVQRALEALQAAYQRRGWGAVYVYLPEQELAGGVVRLNVIEARIDKITVTGNVNYSAANVRRALPDLREGRVPNMVDIAENSRAANENPARQLQVVMRPGAEDGKVDAVVEVKDERPLRPFVSLDNTGTPTTGRYRLGVGVQHASLWERDHIATVQYITSPTEAKHMSVYSLGYRFPIPTWGHSVDLYAGYSDVSAAETQTPAGPLNIAGKGKIAGGRYNIILRRRGEFEQRVILGQDYRAFDNQCSLGSFGAAGCAALGGNPGSDVTVRPMSVGYTGQWSEPARQVAFNLTVARNLAGGSNGDQTAFDAIRAGAPSGYTILRFGVQGGMSGIAGDWQLRANLTGQRSSAMLIPGEQFGIGGYNTVRGFYEREVLGDYGHTGNLEVYTPELGPKVGWKDLTLRALGFVDAGVAYIRNPVAGQFERDGIASIGLGARAALGRKISLRLDAARVLRPGGSKERGDGALHFGAVASF